jgi:hypothetical protein
MHLAKGTSVALVVRREWANLSGVRIFLRRNESPPGREIGGSDDSHIVFADVLDSDDPKGLWIELNTEKHKEDPSVERFPMLVPWIYILTVVLSDKLSPEIYETAKKIGFNATGQREF